MTDALSPLGRPPVRLSPQPDLFGAPPVAHDPGGKPIPLGPGVIGRAVFGGPGDCYRYALWRHWAKAKAALIIGMNPSCADPRYNDATIAGLTRKVRLWSSLGMGEFGGFAIVNTFAYRAKDQLRLMEVADPIGPENDEWILRLARSADLIVMACGKPKMEALQARGVRVANMLIDAGHDLYAFKVSADGTPWHPLYIADGTAPILWRKGATPPAG